MARRIVCSACAAYVARRIVIGTTTYSACVLIFFSRAARMTDTMLGAMTTVVTSGIVSAPATATPSALSGRAVTGRGAAARTA